jgi:hypothetical protein
MTVNNLSASTDPGREPQPAGTPAPKGLGLVASVVLLVMALVAASSLAFAAGRLTAPAAQAAATASPTSPVADWLPGGMWGGRYAAVLSGKVTAVDSSGITITLPGGRSATIAVNRSTVYRVAGSQGKASLGDVSVGSTVTVTLAGQRTLIARSVVIRNINT